MQWKAKRILWSILCAVALLVILAALDYLGPTYTSADSGSSTGFYGYITYTCEACGIGDCWTIDDSVEVLTYPDKNPTGTKARIIRAGSYSGTYSGLIPEDAGYWYLQGEGTYCGSDYYQVWWSGMSVAVEQNIDMQYDTQQGGPQN